MSFKMPMKDLIKKDLLEKLGYQDKPPAPPPLEDTTQNAEGEETTIRATLVEMERTETVHARGAMAFRPPIRERMVFKERNKRTKHLLGRDEVMQFAINTKSSEWLAFSHLAGMTEGATVSELCTVLDKNKVEYSRGAVTTFLSKFAALMSAKYAVITKVLDPTVGKPVRHIKLNFPQGETLPSVYNKWQETRSKYDIERKAEKKKTSTEPENPIKPEVQEKKDAEKPRPHATPLGAVAALDVALARLHEQIDRFSNNMTPSESGGPANTIGGTVTVNVNVRFTFG